MAKKKQENYGPMDRKAMEAAEEGKTIQTDLPSDRYSGEVQTVTTKDSVTPVSDVAGSGIKKDIVAQQVTKVARKVKVKPTSSDTLINDTQVGGVPIGSGQAVTYSAAGAIGDVATVNDASRIPYTNGGYRPDSRQAKVTSDKDFIINNAISEQIIPEFEGTKDLRHNPNALQGYNGQKQFKTARGKKNAGTVPQSTLFDRSIDFHKFDATIHTTGQVIKNNEAGAGYPTKTAINNLELDENKGYTGIAVEHEKSNYLLKSFTFTLVNGKLDAASFNEDKLVTEVKGDEIYQANQNWQVDRNNVAKSVVRLQKELGRETTDNWSPLGYVLHQPYEYNMLAHDIEATTGAMQCLAYRAANTSLAYQSANKLAKDGAKPQTPVVEMFLDGMGTLSRSITTEDLNGLIMNDFVFSNAFCKAGSASAIIKMFDSTSKYTTKANFFNLPRSLKYFVQTMDNNINPLHCKKEFLMALDTVHCYSTVDGEYNPMLPIVATDKISIINPLSLNVFLHGWNRDNVTSTNPAGTMDIYGYKYGDIRNVYYQGLRHPIVDGLMAWLVKHEAALTKAYGENATVTIPCFYSMLAPSMWQILLCAASQEVLWARNKIFRDFLFAGDQTEYIWKDLESLSVLNPKYSSNMTITDYKTPIKLGKLKPASFYKLYWGEQYQVMKSKDPAVGNKSLSVLLPFYYSEDAFNKAYDAEANGFYKDSDHQYTMSYPELRVGVCHDYIDMVYDIEERDFRLALDRAIGIPLYHAKEDPNGAVKFTVYKVSDTVKTLITDPDNISIMALRYDHNSDGRVVVNYKNDDLTRLLPNKAGILCLPREIGFVYPYDRVAPIIDGLDITIDTKNNKKEITKVEMVTIGNIAVNAPIDGSNGQSLVLYAACGDNSTMTISRSSALQQDFKTIFAERTNDVVEHNKQVSTETGVYPSIGSLFASANSFGAAKTNPYYEIGGRTPVNLPNAGSDESSFITLAPAMWVMLSRFFSPINTFENAYLPAGVKDDYSENGVELDPFEAAFMFGLAGFFASDFSQDILNRADIIDQLNIDYTEDEFIKTSLIFRAD